MEIKKIKTKKERKKELQSLLGFKKNRLPLIVCLERNKMIDKLLEGFTSLPLQFALFTEKKLPKNIEEIFKKHSNLSHYQKEISPEKVISSSNAIILFENSLEIAQIAKIQRTVPILPPEKGFSDYDPKNENGNSFIYEKNNIWSLFSAVVRAVETYKLPYDWYGIVNDVENLDELEKQGKEVFISPLSKIFCK